MDADPNVQLPLFRQSFVADGQGLLDPGGGGDGGAGRFEGCQKTVARGLQGLPALTVDELSDDSVVLLE